MARLLAMGPSAVTAWPGWVAAVCFAAGVRRLSSGAPEPPIGRDGATASVAQLRAALRSELRLVGAAHRVVATLALLDSGRLLWFAVNGMTDGLARQGLAALAVETAGLVVATVVLRQWLRRFVSQLTLLGAL
ncbi:MAG: hypothetical protein ABR541_05445 [Candidatus Dormibacteria bacterium]